MKIKGDTDCPHCKKKHDVELDVDQLTLKEPAPSPQVNNPTAEQQTQMMEKPPEIKTEIKTVVPNDQPFYKCKNCSSKHTNDNYKKPPKNRCPNCGSLNGSKSCKTCNKETDPEDWEALTDEELEDLGIPIPEMHEHDHNHESEAE